MLGAWQLTQPRPCRRWMLEATPTQQARQGWDACRSSVVSTSPRSPSRLSVPRRCSPPPQPRPEPGRAAAGPSRPPHCRSCLTRGDLARRRRPRGVDTPTAPRLRRHRSPTARRGPRPTRRQPPRRAAAGARHRPDHRSDRHHGRPPPIVAAARPRSTVTSKTSGSPAS
jgi:hypothetical protein